MNKTEDDEFDGAAITQEELDMVNGKITPNSTHLLL